MDADAIGHAGILGYDFEFSICGDTEDAAMSSVDQMEAACPIEGRPFQERVDRAVAKPLRSPMRMPLRQPQCIRQACKHFGCYFLRRLEHSGSLVSAGLAHRESPEWRARNC